MPRLLAVTDLAIDDESSFRHVEIYGELKRALRDAKFLIVAESEDAVRLLNLAFWHPEDVAEVLQDDIISADQVAHNAWHAVTHRALGDDARTADGMLLAEAIASAFDVYLVGRLLGHAPESDFLMTQVPAMSEAAAASGLDGEGFEALLEQMAEAPERSFESLRSMLFEVASDLVGCSDLAAATAVLRAAQERPFAALLHHYELPTWVLYARAYAASRERSERVWEIHGQLAAADDPVAWLQAEWLAH